MERIFTGRGSSLALALLCSKAFIPIKLPVALAITPYVYRRARARTAPIQRHTQCRACVSRGSHKRRGGAGEALPETRTPHLSGSGEPLTDGSHAHPPLPRPPPSPPARAAPRCPRRWREKLLKQAAARVVNGKGPGSAV